MAARPGQAYKNVTPDGAWCWFADPRAVYYEGKSKRTYIGWVNHTGDIQIAGYDHESPHMEVSTLHPALQADDHANPSILILPDGRLMVFYSPHSRDPMYYRISKSPENISSWEPQKTIPTNTRPEPNQPYLGFTYPHPCRLTAENNRIYLFWRGGNFKPTFAVSDNAGKSWTKARTLITSDYHRPYIKYASDGVSKIHLAFTDGHPRRAAQNNIYYACYYNNAFHKADGTKIKNMSKLPLKVAETEKVYDGASHQARSWVWDVAFDDNGYPVIAYASLPEETDHRYRYARWDGKKWHDHEICPAGKWFPQTPPGRKEPEPHYSAGLILDHSNPSRVYLSRPGKGAFEIEKWITSDFGASWKTISITAGSRYHNIRPFVVRNHAANGPKVLWMNISGKYINYTDFNTSIKMDIPAKQHKQKKKF
ncbi:MAG: hypothetical protein AMJ79_05535 [Phycisphaerae bacterium SM23_30]|nr:MAG: hypothetical protein AMJ79_05535 [Phycisphaerae bacterium SM23_30]